MLRLVPWTEPTPSTAAKCRPDAAYLVTGGLGGVGLEVARWLVGRGARHLVLVGRTALPPRADWGGPDEPHSRQVAGILDLESRGARVESPALDVADESRVAAFVEARRGEGLPEIRGVVHAAAVTDDHLLASIARDSFTPAPSSVGRAVLIA